MISKLKSYGLSLLGLALAVIYGLFRIKSAKVQELKKQAVETQLKAANKQREQADKTIAKLKQATKDADENVKKAIERARSGRRDHFE